MKLQEALDRFDALEKTKDLTSIIAFAKETVKDSASRISKISNKLKTTNDELESIYAYTEKDFDDYCSKLVTVVNDPSTYFRASTIYNAEWFRSLPYSIDSKIHIAQLLIDTVSNYNASYCSSLWKAIVANNIDALNLIRGYTVGAPGNDL